MTETKKLNYEKSFEYQRNEKIVWRQKYVVIACRFLQVMLVVRNLLKIHIKKYRQAAVELKLEDYILMIFPNFHF